MTKIERQEIRLYEKFERILKNIDKLINKIWLKASIGILTLISILWWFIWG